MVVGAGCRDILHSASGHSFTTAATRDLDLGLALTSWVAYRALAAAFPRISDTGIRRRRLHVHCPDPYGSRADGSTKRHSRRGHREGGLDPAPDQASRTTVGPAGVLTFAKPPLRL